MDNNNYSRPPRDNDDYSRPPRKRVTKQMAQRRRMAALAILILVFLLLIVIICKACSSDDDDTKGNTTASTTTVVTTTATTAPIQTATTTTVQAVTADPDDPNTITYISLDKYSVSVEIGETADYPVVTMTPSDSTEKGEIWESSDESIATVNSIGNITGVSAGTCTVTVTSKNNPSIYAEVKVTVIDPDGDVSGAAGQTATEDSEEETSGVQQTNQKPHSTDGAATAAPSSAEGEADIQTIDGITYVNGIMIANKTYSLPESYNPGLNSETEAAFEELSAAAAEEGLDIWLASGYRSYEYQSQIYNNYSSLYGSDTADTFSARPGHSEHQTGYAIDVNTIDDSFAGTPEAIWLENHAYEYGFIIRYPKGKESITGYKYEPWHIRYLGVETATAVYNSGLTLEEYLGIDSVYAS